MKIRMAAILAVFGLGMAAPAVAQSDALQIHGYLSQGWAGATDYGYLGIPEEPTTDYRAMALQVRYALTDVDALVIQLSHKRMGASMANEFSDDIALDWAFFQHRFGGFTGRIGRLPLRRGLYNEIRDVGVLLPFFRAPFNFYTEGVETLDGLALQHRASLPKGWVLESEVQAGEWDYQQVSFRSGSAVASEARVHNAIGGNVWLKPPVRGIKVGGGYQHFELDEPMLTGQADPRDGYLYQFAGEAKFDRVRFAAEWGFFAPGAFDYTSWYTTAGARLVDQLWLNGQVEQADMEIPTPMGVLDVDYSRDYAVGLSYAYTPRFVLKLEGHQVDGYNLDTAVDMTGPSMETRYFVASISAAF